MKSNYQSKKPCNGLCDKYKDGICHNYCLLTPKDLKAKKIKLEKIQEKNN